MKLFTIEKKIKLSAAWLGFDGAYPTTLYNLSKTLDRVSQMFWSVIARGFRGRKNS
jgi:hypothetical protein